MERMAETPCLQIEENQIMTVFTAYSAKDQLYFNLISFCHIFIVLRHV